MLGLFHHKYIVNLLIIYYFFDSYVSLLLTIIKQMDCYASLNHNIYIVADATPVDVDHAAHVCHCIVRPQCLLRKP